jgi:hypothetical protein
LGKKRCPTWIGDQYKPYTDEKERKKFLIYKEIQKGAVAKSQPPHI